MNALPINPLPDDHYPPRKYSIGVDQGSSLYHRKVAHEKVPSERVKKMEKKGGEEGGEGEEEKKEKKEEETITKRTCVLNHSTRDPLLECGKEEVKKHEERKYHDMHMNKVEVKRQPDVATKLFFTLIVLVCICWVMDAFR